MVIRLTFLMQVRIRRYTTQIQKPETQEPSTTIPSEEKVRPHIPHIGTRRTPNPKQWHLLAGVLLSRPPLLLPQLHPFEEQVQQYQAMIERHQYTRFPINFFFKQGSIAEKRWRQKHPREAKKSGSGILRESEDNKNMPEWIVGGKSDEQVMKARSNAPEPVLTTKQTKAREELSDEEKKDLEQYAAEEEEFDEARSELPEHINLDLHRIERQPRQTVYCLVRNSQEWHKKTGKPDRGWSLIEGLAPGVDPENKVEGLHMV
jgi:39S mitochondrial ribosomal protein L46